MTTDSQGHDQHLTYEDYERLITEAVAECRRLSADRNSTFAQRSAARKRMIGLKNDCEDAYGRNPGGW